MNNETKDQDLGNDADKGRDPSASLLAALEKERAFSKSLDAVIDEEGVAVSCINPREDLVLAIRSLKERLTAIRKQAENGHLSSRHAPISCGEILRICDDKFLGVRKAEASPQLSEVVPPPPVPSPDSAKVREAVEEVLRTKIYFSHDSIASREALSIRILTAIAPYLAQPAEKNVNLSRTVSNVFDALFENYVSDENDDGNYTLKLNAAATVKFFKQGREWMLSDLAQPSLPAGPSREVTDAELLEWVGNDPDRLDAAYQFFMSSSKSLREAIQSASASAAKEGEKS